MSEKIVREKHYGRMVYCHQDMDRYRRDECLCLNCAKLGRCEVGTDLYNICKSSDLALAVTRCPMWQEVKRQ